MPAEQSNERVKSWTLWICSACGGGAEVADDPTVCKTLCRTCGSDREPYRVEVIPANSDQVLSVEEARLIADNLGAFANSYRDLAPIRKRLSDFAEEAGRG